jgi:hypothetical protein
MKRERLSISIVNFRIYQLDEELELSKVQLKLENHDIYITKQAITWSKWSNFNSTYTF